MKKLDIFTAHQNPIENMAASILEWTVYTRGKFSDSEAPKSLNSKFNKP